jgi:hypothetical protein
VRGHARCSRRRDCCLANSARGRTYRQEASGRLRSLGDNADDPQTEALAAEVGGDVEAGGEDPRLYRERRQPLGGLHDAVEGLERARVVLAHARHRLEGERVAS